MNNMWNHPLYKVVEASREKGFIYKLIIIPYVRFYNISALTLYYTKAPVWHVNVTYKMVKYKFKFISLNFLKEYLKI